MKTCKTCKLEKEDSSYRISKKTKKLLNPCFDCRKNIKEEYNKTHLEINNATKDAWKLRNIDKVRAAKKKWKEENIGKVKADRARRKFRIEQATPKWLSSQQIEAMEFFYLWADLRSKSGVKYHVDHIIPIAGKDVCGLNVPWNLETLKEEENLKKRNKLLWWRTNG